MKIEYEILTAEEIKEVHRDIFAEMLKKQGKVNPPFERKASRCKIICIARHEKKTYGHRGDKEKDSH